MKTKLKMAQVLIAFCALLAATKISAQTMPFTNSLTCDVKVGYELWTPGCDNCGFGTLTIPAKTTVNLTLCNPTGDICVWVISIGGNAVAANHEAYGPCHVLTPYGTSGTDCNTTWNSTLIPPPFTGWVIQ